MSFPWGRVIFRLVLVAVVGVVIWLIAQVDWSESEKHFRVDRAGVTVEVRDDASLHVTEQLRFDFTGSFSGAYRDIPLAEGVRARNVSVSEAGEDFRPGGNTELGSFDLPGTFGATRLRFADAGDDEPNAGFRVVWHYQAVDEARTFEVSYDIEGAARAYDDVVEVPWAVWGAQWDFWLDDLDARIVLADGDEDPIDGWLRPRKLDEKPDLTPGEASVHADRLAAGDETVLSAVFPRSAFSSVAGAQSRDGDGLEAIRSQEAELDDELGVADSFAAWVSERIALVEIAWTALVLAAAMFLYFRGREEQASVPRHLAEPPDDAPPALAYAYAHEGGFDDRLVLATFLDLVDRGFYDAKPTEGKELDLEVAVAADRPADAPLEDYERLTLGFFDGLLAKGGPCELGKLKERIPKHSSTWRERWQKLTEALDRAEDGKLEWSRDLTGMRATLALVAFGVYVVIGLAYFSRTHLAAIPIFATFAGLVGIYLLPANWLRRLDHASRERNAQWLAFARWTKDFPRLSDDPPATLALWRRILVYGVAFGTAERLIASGRIPAPVLEEAAATGIWLGPQLGGSDSSFLTPSFESFASGFASQVAPESSSSDGGGGFSGGGGGSSGGGGGGAW
ncbi:hypothetical protein BH24ACT23_BH24ACT23_11260 [soil metagenome]